jgi:hypothetical protein
MTLEQLNFCLYTVNKGDQLYVAYEENFVRKEYTNPKIVTYQDISHIVELLTVPKKERKHVPLGFYAFEDDVEEQPVLLRKHRNKYYDIYGNRVTVW